MRPGVNRTVVQRLGFVLLGFITLVFGIGQVISPSLAGWIADRTGSFSLAFVLAGTAALFGVIGCLFLKSRHA